MSKEMKGLILKELKGHFRDLKECLVVGLSCMKVEKSHRLRSTLREEGARMLMVKNSLARLALKEGDREALGLLIEGPTAVVFGEKGIIPLVKKLKNWTKENEDLVIRGGFLDNRLISSEEVDRLSKIPGREVLLSQVLSGISSPATRFLNLLQVKFQEFAQCLKAVQERMAAAGG